MNRIEAQAGRSSAFPERSKWRVALLWTIVGLLVAFIAIDKGWVLYRSWQAKHWLKGQENYVTEMIREIRFVPNQSPVEIYSATVDETFFGDLKPGKLLITKLSPTAELWIAWRKDGEQLESMTLMVQGRSVLDALAREGTFPSGLGMRPLTGPEVGCKLIDSNWDGVYETKIDRAGKPAPM